MGAWLAIGVWCLFLLAIVPTMWLKVERVRCPVGINRKLLQISDLHVEMLRISAARIAQIIAHEKPDYIMLTGDFTRKLRYLPKVEAYLTELKACGVPMYAVLGNHDYKMRSPEPLISLLERCGVRVMRNESVQLEGFQLVGIDDYASRHSNTDASFRHVNGPGPVLVITHDPNVVLRIKHRFDYLMAGHLHGKQFNVPFFFKLKRKGELPSRGIYKGLHRIGSGFVYISKGIGQAGVNARLLVRSEITVHEL